METFDFVRDKLSEWGLSKWIHRFEDEGIDKESFLSLEESEITALIPKIGPARKFRNKVKKFLQKEQRAAGHDRDDPAQEEQGAAANSAQIGPSTSNFSPPPVAVKGKRKSESSKQEATLSKRHRGSVSGTSSEEKILAEMKEIMKRVHDKMNNQVNTKVNAFLKEELDDLESDKKQLVGVIGKTGDGKSSLINAIIGEEDLLPSGSGSACTSVMIKVEANMSDSKYMAEIEFITKEEWKDELSSLSKKYFPGDNVNEENEDGDDDDDDDGGDDDDDEKLSALYGKDFKKSWTQLMDNKHFSEIPEFLKSRKKILTDESALKLSDKLAKYTRSDEEETGRQYWPLVKCVTIKVPNVTDLLEHVTLVDLPGSGDCNKSRDEMWKEIVGSCSTVWIVTDINRAASKKEPWEILDNTISLMGNGGECRSISFICTKSDAIKDSRVIPTEEGRACILKRNKQTKERVTEKFNKQNNIKKHFSGHSDDFFQVLTVSSSEFQKEVFLQKDETEIPKLQECLRNFNDRQSKISNYVSGAYGILSLIHGANSSKMDCHKPLLQQRLKDELDKVRQSMEKAYRAFENCLGEGVKKSQESYAKKMKFILVPKKGKDRGFHRTLKSLVENDGIYKPKTKPEIDINVTLASCMRDHIDEEFKQTFPNKERCGPFKGAINMFTLGTENLVDRNKDVSLQLTFLKTEEAKLKTKLNNYIRENKKKIYSSLPNSIKDSMRPCYEEAANYRGKDTLKNMRNTIETHLKVSKNIMFSKAKDDMLDQMKRLMEHILKKLEKDMKRSIKLSLKSDNSVPDVTDEYVRGKKCHDELMDKSNKETPMTCVEPLKPEAAPDFKSVTHAQEHNLKRPAQDRKKSIKLSRMKTDDNSVPDVTEQYQRGKKCHDKLMGSHKKKPPMACVEPLKPEAASDFQSVTHAQEHIPKRPEQDMKKSSELSLKTDDNSVPDVTEQYQRGKKCHDKLMGNPNKETPLTCVEPLKPEAASDFQSVTHAQSHVSSVTILNPRILHETDDHKPSYRLDCPGPGLFQCASTGLVFEMEKKGEVFYRTVDWDNLLRTLTPAGPLFSIQCPCVRQLHLPHCEILSG
uniref:nuclear GTPase SLIP-GC-like n=1 Tax=Centroberyx gerrardi TaxID=166262 RepID=UPI003AAF7544